jgi:hypothetical protein
VRFLFVKQFAQFINIPKSREKGGNYVERVLTLSLPILYLEFVWVISILKPKMTIKRSLYTSRNRILHGFSGWIMSK